MGVVLPAPGFLAGLAAASVMAKYARLWERSVRRER